MTLTSILPSLRRSVPDPIDIDCWPELTHLTTTDVVVSGISMLRLAELCQTPCIHTAAAVIPGTHGRPSPLAEAAVVVTSITAIVRGVDGERIALIDACLEHVPAVWREARLVGRASTARPESFRVLAARPDCAVGAAIEVPGDLRVGDLLAIPCSGMVVLRDLRESAERREGDRS